RWQVSQQNLQAMRIHLPIINTELLHKFAKRTTLVHFHGDCLDLALDGVTGEIHRAQCVVSFGFHPVLTNMLPKQRLCVPEALESSLTLVGDSTECLAR